jgi:cysteine-rich repeat protein
VLVPGAGRALDLTGKWRFTIPSVPAQIVPVTQSGNSLSLVYAGLSFSGTVTSAGPFTNYSVTASMPPSLMAGIAGRIMPSGNLLDGRAVAFSPPMSTVVSRLVGTRCTCDDGNTANGDGCDAECRVEPCWTCTGDPSTCLPAQEGSACEDGSACTTGET